MNFSITRHYYLKRNRFVVLSKLANAKVLSLGPRLGWLDYADETRTRDGQLTP